MNRRIGWSSLAVGVATGLVIGLWSFDGPLPVPAWLGAYGDTPRRLARLGHIAFIGLGGINILLERELEISRLSASARRLASIAMNVGNVLLPLTLFAAALWRPAKYAMGLPATSVFVALTLAAWGTRRQTGVRPGSDQGQTPKSAPEQTSDGVAEGLARSGI